MWSDILLDTIKNVACNTENKKIISISQYFPVFPTLRVLDRAVFPGKYRPGISRTTLVICAVRYRQDGDDSYMIRRCDRCDTLGRRSWMIKKIKFHFFVILTFEKSEIVPPATADLAEDSQQM